MIYERQTSDATPRSYPMDVRLQMLLPDIQRLVQKLIGLADLAAIAMDARQGGNEVPPRSGDSAGLEEASPNTSENPHD
jgi:hypothetical protein